MTFLSVFIITYTDILDFSKVSFYNYVSNGVFEFGHLDLTRMVRYEKKKNTNNSRIDGEMINKFTDYSQLSDINSKNR